MGGTFKLEIRPDVTGPISDGRADKALQDWAENTAKALGDEGVKLLRDFPMNKSKRAKGGFQANLQVIQDGPTARIPAPMIEGVTWGPWLEGTSQRNSSTRFRGYHLFRKTKQELQRRAPDIGQQELDKIMPQLGGD